MILNDVPLTFYSARCTGNLTNIKGNNDNLWGPKISRLFIIIYIIVVVVLVYIVFTGTMAFVSRTIVDIFIPVIL